MRRSSNGGLHHRARFRSARVGAAISVVSWLAMACLLTGSMMVFVVEPFTVTSDSMRPGLTSGDRVVVEKLSLRWRAPERGEIVVMNEPGSGGLTVKRVVALGGDVLAFEAGRVTLNGDVVDEPYVKGEPLTWVFYGPTVVPMGTVFVLGDAREGSIDSRRYGPVPLSSIVGRVIAAS
jgi:signal peptidase I